MRTFPKSTIESFLRWHNLSVAAGVSDKFDELLVEYSETTAMRLATIVKHAKRKTVKVEDFDML